MSLEGEVSPTKLEHASYSLLYDWIDFHNKFRYRQHAKWCQKIGWIAR